MVALKAATVSTVHDDPVQLGALLSGRPVLLHLVRRYGCVVIVVVVVVLRVQFIPAAPFAFIICPVALFAVVEYGGGGGSGGGGDVLARSLAASPITIPTSPAAPPPTKPRTTITTPTTTTTTKTATTQHSPSLAPPQLHHRPRARAGAEPAEADTGQLRRAHAGRRAWLRGLEEVGQGRVLARRHLLRG